MQYSSVKGYTGWSQLGILLLFTGLGIILAGICQLAIGSQLVAPGIPASEKSAAMMKAFMSPENVGYARVSQILGTFFIMCVPALLYLWVCHGRNSFWLGFNRYINYKQVIVGFFLIFLANLIAAPLADLSKSIVAHFPALNEMALNMEKAYQDQVKTLSNLGSWGEFFMALAIMAFFPALFEELFFRGALQGLLERWWKKPLLALIVTSLVFSFIHASIYLFLSRAVLGFVLGLMYQRSRNIWVNIIAHFLNNAVVLMQLFWITSTKGKIEPDKLDPRFPVWVGLFALGLTVALFYFFDKASDKNRTQIAFQEQNLLDQQGGHPQSLA